MTLPLVRLSFDHDKGGQVYVSTLVHRSYMKIARVKRRLDPPRLKDLLLSDGMVPAPAIATGNTRNAVVPDRKNYIGRKKG